MHSIKDKFQIHFKLYKIFNQTYIVRRKEYKFEVFGLQTTYSMYVFINGNTSFGRLD